MSTLARQATITTSTGDVPGRWWWDPARPWVLHLEVPGKDGVTARIGRQALSLVLQGLPLATCRPDVQVWLDTLFSTVPTLRVQLNPPPGLEVRTRRWRTCPTVAALFLGETDEQVPMCLDPKRCEGCPECAAISDRVDVLTAHRGVR